NDRSRSVDRGLGPNHWNPALGDVPDAGDEPLARDGGGGLLEPGARSQWDAPSDPHGERRSGSVERHSGEWHGSRLRERYATLHRCGRRWVSLDGGLLLPAGKLGEPLRARGMVLVQFPVARPLRLMLPPPRSG